MARCPTTPTSASAAATACSPAPGTCRRRSGTRWRRRSTSARTAPTAPSQPLPIARNGQPLSDGREQGLRRDASPTPACVKACPADALRFGEPRGDAGRWRTSASPIVPDKYVDHIYGEKEAGGTSVLYLSSVPFEKLGFPSSGRSRSRRSRSAALEAVPPAVMALGAILGTAYAVLPQAGAGGGGGSAAAHVDARGPRPPRRVRAAGREAADPVQLGPPAAHGVLRPSRWSRASPSASAAAPTSPTRIPWGLWIVFDLVWIAVAAGAFAMAGLIYVFQRKDLYGLGRTAVLMGLLSYSFVTVTLVADLGLPWHFYQLGLQAPEHSAMFEVSWCVGLYVTILALRVPPGAAGALGPSPGAGALADVVRRLRRASPSRSSSSCCPATSLYAAVTAVVFGTLAWLFRGPGARASSRSCWRSPRSRSPPCTRARSARCTCSCRTCSPRSGGRR